MASSRRGRWPVALLVLGLAAVLAFVLRSGEREPRPLGGPVASEAPSAAAAPLDWPDGPELTRSYELEAGEAFALKLDAGDVEVVPAAGAAATVRVELVGGTLPPARFEWTSERSERGTRVDIRHRQSRSWLARLLGGDEAEAEVLVEGERRKVRGKRARIGRVRVELPADSPLELASGVGTLSAADREAPVSVASGAGDVRLARIAAAVKVATGAGDIRLEAVAGDAELESGAGEVEARGVSGRLSVTTGAGSVSFAGAPASVTVDTGAGRVLGELSAVKGAVALTAGMGGIELTLPADADAELLAESGLGSVEALIEGNRLGARRGEALRAELGDGGPRVSLVTGTGGIRVKTSAPPD